MNRDRSHSASPLTARRTLLAGGVAALAAPFTGEAQPAGKGARVGVLSFGVPEPFQEGFRRALLELGYVEGRNLTIEYRWASGQTARLAGLAAELAQQNVDVIVANAMPGVQAAAGGRHVAHALTGPSTPWVLSTTTSV